MHRLAIVTGTLACALLVAGCGGGDSSDGGSSDTKRMVVADGATATFKGPYAQADVEVGIEVVEGKIRTSRTSASRTTSAT